MDGSENAICHRGHPHQQFVEGGAGECRMHSLGRLPFSAPRLCIDPAPPLPDTGQGLERISGLPAKPAVRPPHPVNAMVLTAEK
jgi:hypothetical protein